MIELGNTNNVLTDYFKQNNSSNSNSNSVSNKESKNDKNQLSPEEQRQVEDLKKRDSVVKAHERAHLSAGGNYVRGGANYTYQKGPDGQLYAIGGEVSIDTSNEKNPEDTIRKAQLIRKAALAPAEPSSTDRAVAAKATQMEQQARIEIAKKAAEEKDVGYYNSLGLVKNSFPSQTPPLAVNFLV